MPACRPVHKPRCIIVQAQCPQLVGNEVLNFQVVGRGGFQLARLHQRLLVAELAGLQLVDQHIQGFFVLPMAAEPALLGGLAGCRFIEGFYGEAQGKKTQGLGLRAK